MGQVHGQGSAVDLHHHPPCVALPALLEEGRQAPPVGESGPFHRVQHRKCLGVRVDPPVNGDQPRWQVSGVRGLEGKVQGTPRRTAPLQRLLPQAGRIDGPDDHQAVGSALVLNLDAGQRLPSLIHHLHPQAAGELRRLDHHLAGGIAHRLGPAGSVGAGGEGELRLRHRGGGAQGQENSGSKEGQERAGQGGAGHETMPGQRWLSGLRGRGQGR